jgi:hypothetical protein
MKDLVISDLHDVKELTRTSDRGQGSKRTFIQDINPQNGRNPDLAMDAIVGGAAIGIGSIDALPTVLNCGGHHKPSTGTTKKTNTAVNGCHDTDYESDLSLSLL